MTTRSAGGVCAVMALAVLAASTNAAPDPAAIMKKAGESVTKAKTYQSTWRVVVTMGDMGSMSMDMVMKMASGGKAFVSTTPAGKPTGMMAAGANMAASTTVSDGKTAIIYMKGMNSYQKMPAPKGKNPGFGGMFGDLTKQGAKYKYIGTQVVRGRNCHVIQIDQPTPQNGGPNMKADVKAFVDQSTGRLRQIKSVMTMSGMGPGMAGGPPGAGSGQGAKPMTMTNTMVLMSEKLNAPIPASTFKFTPPPGAKEMKGGAMGMGGPPGRPGGRPGAGPPRP